MDDYDSMGLLDNFCRGPDDDTARPGTHACCDKTGHMLAVTDDPGVLEVRRKGHGEWNRNVVGGVVRKRPTRDDDARQY